MTIRERAPRLVLRTACETLPTKLQEAVLTAAKAKRLGT
jgi:hypothetical protein